LLEVNYNRIEFENSPEEKETVLSDEGGIYKYVHDLDTLQFFINCAQDLNVLGEDVCFVTNTDTSYIFFNWPKSKIIQNKFSIYYYQIGEGHQAPREEDASKILYTEEEAVQNVSSHGWIFIYCKETKEAEKLANKLHREFSRTCFYTSENKNDLIFVKKVWRRSNMLEDAEFSETTHKKYKHVCKM